MEDFLAESKGLILFLVLLFVGFFIFIARPHQLDSLLSFATPARDRVVIAVHAFERVNKNEKPTENLKRIATKFAEWSGLPYDEAEGLCTSVATEYHGGLVSATVVASELQVPTAGDRYLLFSEYDWSNEPLLVIDYEPDYVGTIFYTPEPVYMDRKDPRLAEYASRYPEFVRVAWAEMRKPGFGDRALIKKARKYREEQGLPKATGARPS
ncbi:MAG: hypothetical protein V2G42_04730 [bacterium JZ-2024 1]